MDSNGNISFWQSIVSHSNFRTQERCWFDFRFDPFGNLQVSFDGIGQFIVIKVTGGSNDGVVVNQVLGQVTQESWFSKFSTDS